MRECNLRWTLIQFQLVCPTFSWCSTKEDRKPCRVEMAAESDAVDARDSGGEDWAWAAKVPKQLVAGVALLWQVLLAHTHL